VEIIRYYMCLVLNHCLEDQRGPAMFANKAVQRITDFFCKGL
jgi:hypothetical protein